MALERERLANAAPIGDAPRMPASMHEAVAAVVATRRLASLDEAASNRARQRFTVSREQALLQLRNLVRQRGGDPLAWTLQLVRAANSLSELAEARITVESDEATTTSTIDVIVPGFEFVELDLSDMLAGALEPDLGEPLGLDDEDELHTLRARRFRMLIGRALNEALAGDPIALELQTPLGGRRFERREQVQGKTGELERDAYGERKSEACVGRSRFVLRVVEPRPSLGTRLGRWLRGRSELTKALTELWSSQLVRERDEGIVGEDGQLLVSPALARPAIAFGRHAHFGPARGLEGKSIIQDTLWLVRDGVRRLDIGSALTEAGLPVRDMVAGWIDCPSLRLTADEQGIVRDAAFELLVAWFHDALAHRVEGAGFEVRWPADLSGLVSASEQPVGVDELELDDQNARERVFVWRHRTREVPAFARTKLLAPWPSELERLRERHPGIKLVPLRALGNQVDFDPADLTALRAGSLEPLVLAREAVVGLAPELAATAQPGGGPLDLRMAIEAYVHRSPAATMGFVELLAYERRVAKEQAPGKIIPGVTLIVRLSSEGGELDVPTLRRAYAICASVIDQARAVALEHREALLAHVLARSNAWENPFVRGALDELGGVALELAYRRTDAGLRLAWRDSVLLDVAVARDRAAAGKTLRDALRRVRETGVLVLAKDERSHVQLLSKEPELQPWILHEWARPLLERVLGPAALFDMPVVPEAHPLVRAAIVDDQRHLLRTAPTLQGELQRKDDRLARLRLLGHLLVARGLERETFGLDDVPLLDRYDPRALQPSRRVSLKAALAERPRPTLVPTGAVHRNLAAPVLEVGPGVAALLHEVGGFEPHAPGSKPAVAHASAAASHHGADVRGHAIRRRARELPPLLAASVVHGLFVGRLLVAGDGESEGIGLWSRGLRVNLIELDEPLRRVSGRLWLTQDGQRAGPLLMHREVVERARLLVASALQQRALLPEGPQRRRLDAFVEFARGVVRKSDPYELAEALGAKGLANPAERVAKLKQMSLDAAPLRPLLPRRDGLLLDVIKQSLAMKLRFDVGYLQWRAAKLGKRHRDGSLELEIGKRNAWIQRAVDADAKLHMPEHREAALRAGVIVLAEFFGQARAQPELGLGPEHLVVALWRLLKLG